MGLGMNEVEVRENPRLDTYVIQDLNRNPSLPFGDGEFDGAGICVSVDYVTSPVEVLREVGRVLKVGAPLVVTFSNGCLPKRRRPCCAFPLLRAAPSKRRGAPQAGPTG